MKLSEAIIETKENLWDEFCAKLKKEHCGFVNLQSTNDTDLSGADSLSFVDKLAGEMLKKGLDGKYKDLVHREYAKFDKIREEYYKRFGKIGAGGWFDERLQKNFSGFDQKIWTVSECMDNCFNRIKNIGKNFLDEKFCKDGQKDAYGIFKTPLNVVLGETGIKLSFLDKAVYTPILTKGCIRFFSRYIGEFDVHPNGGKPKIVRYSPPKNFKDGWC